MDFRLAIQSDVEALCLLDPVARFEERRNFIQAAVTSASCWVAEVPPLAGYMVMGHHFFGCGFVDLLFVHEKWRRRGVASGLMRLAVEKCKAEKLFTSTNASNTAAQRLFLKSGFIESGVVHNLDEDDPELIFLKPLK